MKCAWKKKLGRRNNTASAGLTPQLQLDRGLVEEPEARLGLELGQELVLKLVMELILRKGKKILRLFWLFKIVRNGPHLLEEE